METIQGALPYAVGVTLFAVLAVLFTGIGSMFKGGDFNRKYGNKLMRMRVLLQGVAILLLGLLFLVSRD